MRETVVSREADAPADHVWSIATDIDRAPQVVSAIASVERVDAGEGFGVGTRWRETRHLYGRRATEEMWVTAVDPGRSYTVEADGAGGAYRSTTRVEPLERGRSRVSIAFASIPGGPVARLVAATIGRLLEGPTRRALRQDLDDIVDAAERTT
jgi:carbon monoxide dehydrogenase subunit G